jgi:hypothetical protein
MNARESRSSSESFGVENVDFWPKSAAATANTLSGPVHHFLIGVTIPSAAGTLQAQYHVHAKGRRVMQWTELFVAGAPAFWALLVVETILLIALIELGKGALATLSFVAALLLLYFLGDTNVLGFALHHPLLLPLGAISYFAIGTCWAIAKWWLYVRDQRSGYDELRTDFCHEHRLDGTIPERLQQAWLERLQASASRRRRIEIRPRARQHKGNILTWMAYWPWSLGWTILNDPVRNAFRFVYHHIHDYLQEISDHAFKGVEQDFPRGGDEGPAQSHATEPAIVGKTYREGA